MHRPTEETPSMTEPTAAPGTTAPPGGDRRQPWRPPRLGRLRVASTALGLATGGDMIILGTAS